MRVNSSKVRVEHAYVDHERSIATLGQSDVARKLLQATFKDRCSLCFVLCERHIDHEWDHIVLKPIKHIKEHWGLASSVPDKEVQPKTFCLTHCVRQLSARNCRPFSLMWGLLWLRNNWRAHRRWLRLARLHSSQRWWVSPSFRRQEWLWSYIPGLWLRHRCNESLLNTVLIIESELV